MVTCLRFVRWKVLPKRKEKDRRLTYFYFGKLYVLTIWYVITYFLRLLLFFPFFFPFTSRRDRRRATSNDHVRPPTLNATSMAPPPLEDTATATPPRCSRRSRRASFYVPRVLVIVVVIVPPDLAQKKQRRQHRPSISHRSVRNPTRRPTLRTDRNSQAVSQSLPEASSR